MDREEHAYLASGLSGMDAMSDFLLELRSEEIPARMQERARSFLGTDLATALGQHGIAFFGLTLPRFFGEDDLLSGQFFSVHLFFVWVFLSLIGLHVLAGLKHLIINKDGVFQRMWF